MVSSVRSDIVRKHKVRNSHKYLAVKVVPIKAGTIIILVAILAADRTIKLENRPTVSLYVTQEA